MSTWAQQSTLGDEFATNGQLGMEMPSYDKGAKAKPLAPVPKRVDPRQAAMPVQEPASLRDEARVEHEIQAAAAEPVGQGEGIPPGPPLRSVVAAGQGKPPRDAGWDERSEDCLPLDHARLCRLDPSALHTDAAAFQYKEGGDEAGVIGTLANAKTWDPDLGGVVHVWQRSDGEMFVTDGHQRLEFAKRAQAEGQDVYLLAKVWREIDSPQMGREEQKREMRLRAAKKNIAEGTGTPVDAARVLRDAPSLLDNVSRDNALARDALGLSRLTEPVFQEAAAAVNSGRIDPRVAALISGNARSEDLQRGLLGALAAGHAKNGGLTLGQGAEIIYAYKESAAETPGADAKLQQSFLTEVVQESAWEERDALRRGLVRSFEKDKALFGSVVRGEGRLEAVGNDLDDAANRGELTQAQQDIGYFNALAHTEGPLAHYLTQKAKELKAARDRTGQPLSRLAGPAVASAGRELRPYLKDYDGGGSERLGEALGLRPMPAQPTVGSPTAPEYAPTPEPETASLSVQAPKQHEPARVPVEEPERVGSGAATPQEPAAPKRTRKQREQAVAASAPPRPQPRSAPVPKARKKAPAQLSFLPPALATRRRESKPVPMTKPRPQYPDMGGDSKRRRPRPPGFNPPRLPGQRR